jgi:COMPASS component SPP1
MAEETILCEQMLDLIDLAQNRRRSLIADGRFNDDICGYDYRLDTISARDAFAAFAQSPEGETIFSNKVMGDPAEGTSGSGMCERKRCKVHYGWNKILALGIRYHMKELSAQAGELSEEESIVREAAGERWRRKKAEHNWVEVIEA